MQGLSCGEHSATPYLNDIAVLQERHCGLGLLCNVCVCVCVCVWLCEGQVGEREQRGDGRKAEMVGDELGGQVCVGG